jgi:hypothetical protein
MTQDLKAKRDAKTPRPPLRKITVKKSSGPSSKAEYDTELPDFDEAECVLVQYLTLASKNPLKDARAFQRTIAQVTRQARGPRASSVANSIDAPRGKAQGNLKTAKEIKMGKDAPRPSSSVGTPTKRRPRSAKLTALLKAVLDQPEKWMAAPSMQLGGRRPADLVGTDEEVKIFDILNAVDQGLF